MILHTRKNDEEGWWEWVQGTPDTEFLRFLSVFNFSKTMVHVVCLFLFHIYVMNFQFEDSSVFTRSFFFDCHVSTEIIALYSFAAGFQYGFWVLVVLVSFY